MPLRIHHILTGRRVDTIPSLLYNNLHLEGHERLLSYLLPYEDR